MDETGQQALLKYSLLTRVEAHKPQLGFRLAEFLGLASSINVKCVCFPTQLSLRLHGHNDQLVAEIEYAKEEQSKPRAWFGNVGGSSIHSSKFAAANLMYENLLKNIPEELKLLHMTTQSVGTEFSRSIPLELLLLNPKHWRDEILMFKNAIQLPF